MCVICNMLDNSLPTAREMARSYIENIKGIPEAHEPELVRKLTDTLKKSGKTTQEALDYVEECQEIIEEIGRPMEASDTLQ